MKDCPTVPGKGIVLIAVGGVVVASTIVTLLAELAGKYAGLDYRRRYSE